MAYLFVRRLAGKKAAVCPAHAASFPDNSSPRRSPWLAISA
jgi:hypothetical protein